MTDASKHTVWEARQKVIALYEQAKEQENHVAAKELADIEHRLCLVSQIVEDGSWEYDQERDDVTDIGER